MVARSRGRAPRPPSTIRRDERIVERVSDPSRLDPPGGPAQAGAAARRVDRATKLFRELVREISWLLGYEALADARVVSRPVKTPIEETEGARLGDRIGLVPILRAGLGMVDAMLELDAHGGGLAPGPFPRRADAAAGRVLQQAARLGDRRPVPDPRPDARHRRLGLGRDRGAQDVGRRDAGAHQAAQPDRRAGGRPRGQRQRIRTSTSTAQRWTGSSTRRATSCPDWATRATASSARARTADAIGISGPSGRPMDWVAWHADYEDPNSALSRRLAIVQRHISAFLTSLSGSPVRVVSLCAGEGRDILGAIERVGRERHHRPVGRARPRPGARGRERAAALGLKS